MESVTIKLGRREYVSMCVTLGESWDKGLRIGIGIKIPLIPRK